MAKNTVETFLNAKASRQKLSLLTAYDYTMARIIDESGINGILVGDSLGMVMQGHENTLSVTMEDMIYHTKIVSNGVKNALVIADMPFMSYQVCEKEAVVNAGRLIKETNAHCVKLEGGENIAHIVSKIVNASIPVMGHIGLTPQSVNAMGGFKVQGSSKEAAIQIINDARALEKAGAFAVVLECIPEKIAEIITNKLSIPTIGIGAGINCDGQILVYQDMLGMSSSEFVPRFIKKYAEIGETMKNAIGQYIKEVEQNEFPAKEHTFKINKAVLEEVISSVSN